MNKDKKFILDSIKMDLHRVIAATGDITKKIPIENVEIFLDHADKDFDKTTLNSRERGIRKQLKLLKKELKTLVDPHKRLRWVENVLTARCRL